MRRVLILCLFAMLVACSANDNAENTANVDENLTTNDVATTATNAVEDANPTAEMNATANASDNVSYAPADRNLPAPISARVEKGVGAFVQPPPMQVGRWYTLAFLVAPKAGGSAEESGTLAAEAQGKTTTAAAPVYLASKMRVSLSADPAFKITPKTPEEQPIGLDKSATWQWAVSPLTGGDHELSAEVQPLDAQGNVIDTYTRYVTVHAKVSMGQRLKTGAEDATTTGDVLAKLMRSWEGALLALAALIAAAFAVRTVVRNRGSSAQTKPAASEGEKQDR